MKVRLRHAGLVLAVLGLCSCQRAEQAAAPDAGAAKDVDKSETTVAVVHPVRQDLSRSLTLTAEFKPYQEIDVHARVSGYVREIKVDVGDHVKAGDVIATLDIPEIEEDLRKAEAAVLTAQQNAQGAEADAMDSSQMYTRLQAAGQQAPGLIAQQELDTAAAKNRSSEANVEAAKQRVTEAQAEADRVKTMIDYSTITAPFDGVITRRYADTGALIQAGTSSTGSSSALVNLAEVKRLRLEFSVPESAAGNIQIGDEIDVEIGSLHEKFKAKVSRFAQKVDASTRTMLAEAEIGNDNFRYLPGMYATARLNLADQKDALSVPIQCVSTGTTNTVYVLGSNQKIEQREITLGLETSTMAEVLTGLTEDDQVVVSSRGSLQPGQSVLGKEMASAKP